MQRTFSVVGGDARQQAAGRWLEKQGKVFVIRPSAPIGIKRIEKDADKLQEVYELGLNDGEHSIHALQEYLHALAQRQ